MHLLRSIENFRVGKLKRNAFLFKIFKIVNVLIYGYFTFLVKIFPLLNFFLKLIKRKTS